MLPYAGMIRIKCCLLYTSGQTVQTQHDTNGCAADWKGQRNSNKSRNQHSHKERLHLSCGFYQIAEGSHKGRNSRAYKLSNQHTCLLYTSIAIFAMAKISDGIIEGMKFSKVAFIISDKSEELAERIMKEMKRCV